MAWLPITSDEVKTRLSGPEADALQGTALAEGQVDPLPDVIAQVTDEVRGYIASHGLNTLGPAGTLPPQVRAAAIAIIRWRLAGRLAIGNASGLLQTESRRQEYEDAVSLLRDVSKGQLVVEAPEAVGPEIIPATKGRWGSYARMDFVNEETVAVIQAQVEAGTGTTNLMTGTASPEGTVKGQPPNIYFRDDGVNIEIWIKRSGVNTATGWILAIKLQ